MDSLKYESLLMNIRKYESIAVAFSGGVDSTLLLKAAHDELGERAAAITVESSVLSQSEALEAEEFCKQYGIRHIIMNFDVLSIPEFSKNPKDRCYHCKKALFSEIKNTAMKNGFSVVAEGENADDVNDYRPGMKAIKELDIKSPLKDAGLTKADIRMISHKLGLSTWDKPSYACLATRIPYGELITDEKLKQIERSEQLLHSLGFRQTRVRMHGDLARIEIIPEQFEQIIEPEIRSQIDKGLKEYGFNYVSIDIKGYRTGSMNEVLKKEIKIWRNKNGLFSCTSS